MASLLKPQPASSLSLIYESSLTCLNSFHNSLNTLEDPMALDLAQNQLVRFNLWASNIAAFSTTRSSLDFRLQNSPDIRSMVLQLLSVLQLNLQKAIELKDSPAPDLTLSSTESSSSESSASSSEALNETLGKGIKEVPNSPSIQALKVAESTIDRLQRLSIAIRKSATLSRNLKAAEFKEKDENGNDNSPAFESYATQIVQHRHKNPSKELCKLLGASMSLRRKCFLYFKRHQQKLALQQHHAALPERQLPDISTKLEGDAQASGVPENELRTKPEAPIIARTNLFSHTTASALDPDRFKRVAFTAKTTSTRSEGMAQDFNIEWPPAPRVAEDAKEFECPFCCLVLAVEIALTGRKWRSHVMEDLEPYACVCEGCPHPVTLFRTTKEWLNHLQWEHSLQWSCTAPIHSPRNFDRKEDFEQHMMQEHKDSFTMSQLPVLTKAAATPSPQVLTFCPFCDCLPEGVELGESNANQHLDPLLRHVAAHLKVLAMLCLPYQEYDASFKSTTTGSTVIKRTESAFGSLPSSPDEQDGNLEQSSVPQELGYLDDREGPVDLVFASIGRREDPHKEWAFLPRKTYPELEVDPVLEQFIRKAAEEMAVLVRKIEEEKTALEEAKKRAAEERGPLERKVEEEEEEALLEGHEAAQEKLAQERNIEPVAGATHGAGGAEILPRARRRYRDRTESVSRSKSSSRTSQRNTRTALGSDAASLAAAAAKYDSNERADREGRGRSRGRSGSRHRNSNANSEFDHEFVRVRLEDEANAFPASHPQNPFAKEDMFQARIRLRRREQQRPKIDRLLSRFRITSKPKDDWVAQYYDNRDIKFLIDNSYSMEVHWDRLEYLVETLLLKAEGLDEDGVDLCFTHGSLSAVNIKVKSKIMDKIRDIKAIPKLENKSDVSRRLQEIFDGYLLQVRRDQGWKKKSKQLTILFLTDGIWETTEDKDSIGKAIVTTARSLEDLLGRPIIDRPLSIEFIRFGNDLDAKLRLKRLDDEMVFEGIPDLVDTEPCDGDVNKMLLRSFSPWWDDRDDRYDTPTAGPSSPPGGYNTYPASSSRQSERPSNY